MRILVGIAIFIASSAHGVMIGSGKTGQVLIAPYFTSEADHDTLIQVVSDYSGAKAVKIRFLDRDGEVSETINVYIRNLGAWQGAVTRAVSGSELRLPPSSCALSEDGVVSGSLPLSTDVGYIEVFDLGTIDSSELERLVIDADCEALNQRWLSGAWSSNPAADLRPGEGGLRGSVSIINVLRGDLYGYSMTPLVNFTDTTLHTSPQDSLSPNLGDMNNSDRDSGIYYSTVCSTDGCAEDRWSNPIDAVSAIFMANTMNGEFTIDPNLNAKTDWVILYPTLNFYGLNIGTETHTINSVFIRGRFGNLTFDGGTCTPSFLNRFCDFNTYIVNHDQIVEVISFNDQVAELGSVSESSILGAAHTVDFPLEFTPLPDSGNARLGMAVRDEVFLQSIDGTTFSGRPAVGIVMQQFVNGTLQDGEDNAVISTYGITLELAKQLKRN